MTDRRLISAGYQFIISDIIVNYTGDDIGCRKMTADAAKHLVRSLENK